MTNAEAIKIINQYDCNFFWTDGEKIPTEDLFDAFELAVKALDAQTPKVLTLEEVRDDYDVVWLETMYCPPELCLIDHGESNSKWLRVTYGIDNGGQNEWSRYNKAWRCWSSRPTDEQREATPWGKD